MPEETGNSLQRFLENRMKDGQVSATALVFTFFCDVVTQHGGEMWLGSVIHVLAPLGINERLTRTAVFRLVRDGWLTSRKRGRRSYYRLTGTGENYYRRAAKRIYADSLPAWDGTWTLVFTSQVADDKRDALNRGLTWLGYGRIANSVFALPCSPHPAVTELLEDLGIDDCVVQMRAKADNPDSLRELVTSSWSLNDLKEAYRDFIGHYSGAGELLEKSAYTSQQALLFRVLPIHEFRKILLSDPELPIDMLPANWPGGTARSLTGNLYRQLAAPTTAWLNRELPPLDTYFKDAPGTLDSRFA
jgi:phenylacetic acid degradation operon negative regulatory protein